MYGYLPYSPQTFIPVLHHSLYPCLTSHLIPSHPISSLIVTPSFLTTHLSPSAQVTPSHSHPHALPLPPRPYPHTSPSPHPADRTKQYHPKANIDKMSRGEPLTDADRKSWLEALRDHESVPSEPGKAPHLVITCSALKKVYRDMLREGERGTNLKIRFIFLDAPEEVLKKRAESRKGHFAGAKLVKSQFEILERPGDGEEDVITIDVNREEGEVEKDVLGRVEEMLQRES